MSLHSLAAASATRRHRLSVTRRSLSRAQQATCDTRSRCFYVFFWCTFTACLRLERVLVEYLVTASLQLTDV